MSCKYGTLWFGMMITQVLRLTLRVIGESVRIRLKSLQYRRTSHELNWEEDSVPRPESAFSWSGESIYFMSQVLLSSKPPQFGVNCLKAVYSQKANGFWLEETHEDYKAAKDKEKQK